MRKLTEGRAQSTRQYLVENDISTQRIIVKRYGKYNLKKNWNCEL